MSNELTEDHADHAGEKPEAPSAVLAMVETALDKLSAERRKKEPGAKDLTIGELERLLGITKGVLGSPLKPVNRSRVPRSQNIKSLAAALKISPNELGQAFMDDYLGDGDKKTINRQRAADLVGQLTEPLQLLALRQLEVLVDHCRECADDADA